MKSNYLLRLSLSLGLIGFGASLYLSYQYQLIKSFEKEFMEIKNKKLYNQKKFI